MKKKKIYKNLEPAEAPHIILEKISAILILCMSGDRVVRNIYCWGEIL